MQGDGKLLYKKAVNSTLDDIANVKAMCSSTPSTITIIRSDGKNCYMPAAITWAL